MRHYELNSSDEEHALALGFEHLVLLDQSLQDIGPVPERRVLDDFIIDPRHNRLPTVS